MRSQKSLVFILFCLLLLGTVRYVNGGNLYIHLSFDGTDDYVEVSPSASLNFSSGDFSVQVWIKTLTGTGIVNKWGTVKDIGWFLAVVPSTGKMMVYLSDGVDWVQTTTDETVNDGEWHLLTFTRSNLLKFYINEDMVKQVDVEDIDSIDSNEPLLIGVLDSDDHSDWYTGTKDELLVYSREINSTEISYSFTYKEPQNQTGLAMWLRMNEGSGGTTYDETTNNNDGTLMPDYPSNAPTWIDETPNIPNTITTIPAAEILIAFLPLIALGYVVAVARSPLKGMEKAYAIIGSLIIIVILIIFSSIFVGLQ